MVDIIFKLEYFEPSMHSILSSYTCSICKNIYNTPSQDSQGHIFCRECILTQIKSNSTCPISGDHLIKKSEIKVVDFMQDFVNGLSICCPSKENGCEWHGKVKNLVLHWKQCTYKSAKEQAKEGNKEQPKDCSTEFESAEDLVPCCFSDLGCREMYSKGSESSHFAKYPYHHMYLLFNKFNNEFVKLQERIEKITSRTGGKETNEEYLAKKRTVGDSEEGKFKGFDKMKLFASTGLDVDGSYLTVLSADANSRHLFYIFNDKVRQSFSIKMEVLNYKQWIGVGICDFDVVKDNGYTFKIKSLEHGITCFGFNGYKFNQFGEKKSKITDFPVVTNGTKIKIYFDFPSKVLRLIINGMDWRISKVDTDRNLFPCIMLLGKDESVKLLSYKHIE